MNTLFDKIWDAHVVQKVEDGPTQLYIDRLYCHEVTSPQDCHHTDLCKTGTADSHCKSIRADESTCAGTF